MAVSCIVFLFAEIPSLIEIPKLADKTCIHTLAASKIKRLMSKWVFFKKSLGRRYILIYQPRIFRVNLVHDQSCRSIQKWRVTILSIIW